METTIITSALCKCNKCDSILIDRNPQIGAKEYTLTGNELEMQYHQLGGGDLEWFWACPVCLTDEYLIDL